MLNNKNKFIYRLGQNNLEIPVLVHKQTKIDQVDETGGYERM
jgi:hypothetical protein